MKMLSKGKGAFYIHHCWQIAGLCFLCRGGEQRQSVADGEHRRSQSDSLWVGPSGPQQPLHLQSDSSHRRWRWASRHTEGRHPAWRRWNHSDFFYSIRLSNAVLNSNFIHDFRWLLIPVSLPFLLKPPPCLCLLPVPPSNITIVSSNTSLNLSWVPGERHRNHGFQIHYLKKSCKKREGGDGGDERKCFYFSA